MVHFCAAPGAVTATRQQWVGDAGATPTGASLADCAPPQDSPQYLANLMSKTLSILIWLAIAVLGALALATIALHRGEQINAMWLVVAAVCTYAVGYRFYSKFIAAKVLTLDALRATPAEPARNAGYTSAVIACNGT